MLRVWVPQYHTNAVIDGYESINGIGHYRLILYRNLQAVWVPCDDVEIYSGRD